MGDMRPGNSFPQICVVLKYIVQKRVETAQDYKTSMDVSNLFCLLISKHAHSEDFVLLAAKNTRDQASREGSKARVE
jgi:hypothetical protein